MRKARGKPRPAGTPAVEVVETELARVGRLGLDELRALWRALTQHNAPRALSRDLLARMLAYRVQEQALGKLGRETRKLLDLLAHGGTEPVQHLKGHEQSKALLARMSTFRRRAGYLPLATIRQDRASSRHMRWQ